MTYETITAEQLPNRVPEAYFPGCCGIPADPKQFAVLRQHGANAAWRNVFETDDAQAAEDQVTKMIAQDASMSAFLAQSKKPELRASAAVKSEYKIVEIAAKAEEPEPVVETQKVAAAPEQLAVESAEVPAVAVQAPTDEQPEIAESGKFEVYVSGVAAKPRFLAYRGDSVMKAKAVVARWTGHCSRVITRSRASDGSWVWHEPGNENRNSHGLAWDHHEEYLKNLHEGVFDDAFMRDHLNEEMERGRMTAAQARAEWNTYQERKVSHAAK